MHRGLGKKGTPSVYYYYYYYYYYYFIFYKSIEKPGGGRTAIEMSSMITA